MSVSLCLKAASYGMRLPDGILTSYAPFNVQFRPSPSRLLTLLDPLLPVGILTQCLAAYTGAAAKGSADVSKKPQTESRSSSDDCCCSEDERLSPDFVEDDRPSTTRVPHVSSEFDFVHAQTSHARITRSQSDSVLPRTSNLKTHKNDLHDVTSCRLLTDDHLISMAKNPLISPLVASNEELAKLPPIDLLVSF